VLTPQEGSLDAIVSQTRSSAGHARPHGLQTLAAIGSLHGYGIARRIEQVSGNEVLLNQGTIYASLVRLEQRGWISSSWGISGNNRKARFYAITRIGRRQLAADARYWERLTGVMDRVLAMSKDKGGEPA